MNEMMINYIIIVICAGIAIREIYFFQKNGRVKIAALLGAIVVVLLTAFATFKGIPISKLQVLIEQMFA